MNEPGAIGPGAAPRGRKKLFVRLAILFAIGLLLRLLFQAAIPDGGTCWHLGFQGDAPVWQDLAARIAQGQYDIELVTPWRPPGMTYGVAFLWNGEGATAWPVRLLFTVLGAGTAPLVWLLLRDHVTEAVAWLAAVLCAVSSNLMLLSSGLQSETPYLFTVLVALLDQQRLARERAAGAALRWGLLHGLLCLLRAEHLMVAVVLFAIARWNGAAWRTLALGLVAFAAPLVPWQLHANRQIEEFNRGEPALPATDVKWERDALVALRALPQFSQQYVFAFVSDTMRVRGRDTVRVEDLGVVRDAFGCFPEPLRPQFVAMQGGWSFWLSWTPEAAGGHSRKCLDRPPPLAGGASLYAPWEAARRPRGGQTDLRYPPHLDVFVHGYRHGWQEIAADPLGALHRLAVKLCYAVEGATGGVGGYALPIGLSGVRPSVDMVIATGVWPACWRALVFAVAMIGLWGLRRTRALWPLFAFAVVRLALIAAFFGHARHGALLLPVVALGVAAALHAATAARWPRFTTRFAMVLLVVLPLLEIVRTCTVSASIDGRPWLGYSGGRAEYEPHTITFH